MSEFFTYCGLIGTKLLIKSFERVFPFRNSSYFSSIISIPHKKDIFHSGIQLCFLFWRDCCVHICSTNWILESVIACDIFCVLRIF